MSRYQHTKGQIKDNALEALLHDPLFRQRIEKSKKGKGSYNRKGKHGVKGNWEASGKEVKCFFTTGLFVYCSSLIKGDYSDLLTDRESASAVLLPSLEQDLQPALLFYG